MLFSPQPQQSFIYLISRAQATNIALRNMLGCLLWASCHMVQDVNPQLCSDAPSLWQQLSAALTEHSTSSQAGNSYLTSRRGAGKRRRRRERLWSQLWPNLQLLYWQDECWKTEQNTQRLTWEGEEEENKVSTCEAVGFNSNKPASYVYTV